MKMISHKPLNSDKLLNAISTLTFAVTLVACSGQSVKPAEYEVSNVDVYVPINLTVNSGRYVDKNEAQLLDYIYDSFEVSGLFSKVETENKRWPYTVNINYSIDESRQALDYANLMMSASTMMLVPSTLEEIHRFTVEIKHGEELIKKVNYQQKIKTSYSFYHSPGEGRKNGVNNFLKKLFNDIHSEKVIPSLSEEMNKPVQPVESAEPDKIFI